MEGVGGTDDEKKEPLMQDGADEEEEPEEEALDGRGARLFLAALVLTSFGAMTIFLAFRFPVKKHKFTRFACPNYGQLLVVEKSVFEDVTKKALTGVCNDEAKACQQARRLGAAVIKDSCQDAVCVEVATEAQGLGLSPLDFAVALDSTVPSLNAFGSIGAAISNYCSSHQASWCEYVEDLSTACVASATCDAASQFWTDPAQFCANSTLQHNASCVEAKALVGEVYETCLNETHFNKSALIAEGCTILFNGLEQRGYYTDACNENPIKKTKCKLIIGEAKKFLNEKLCGDKPELCDALYAVVGRYTNVSQDVPVYDVVEEAAQIHCRMGICDPATGLKPYERLEQGSFAQELALFNESLPSICGSWPVVGQVCANVTNKLDSFCGKHSLTCQWLGELVHFDKATAEDLFVETWRDVDAVCAGLIIPRNPDKFAVPYTEGKVTTTLLEKAACELQDGIDLLSSKCPKTFPFVHEAEKKDDLGDIIDNYLETHPH